MSDDQKINIFRVLDFLRDSAETYADAEATRVYIETFLKSKKAMLMKEVASTFPSAAAQEREAMAHPEYLELLEALREATKEKERLRYLIDAAKVRADCWRSLESSKRTEQKIIP
jgi:hypothetical protein